MRDTIRYASRLIHIQWVTHVLASSCPANERYQTAFLEAYTMILTQRMTHQATDAEESVGS